MSETIKDGRGTGYLAGVNNHGQLKTIAVDFPIEHFLSAIEQSVYTTIVPEVQLPAAATASFYPLLWLKNVDQSKHFHIDEIYGSWNGGDTNHNRIAYIRLYANSSAPTAGSSSITANPTFIGAGTIAQLSAYTWDQVTSGGMSVTTSGTLMSAVHKRQGWESFEDVSEGLIIGVGQSLLLSVRAEEPGNLSLGVVGYFYDDQTL